MEAGIIFYLTALSIAECLSGMINAERKMIF